MALDHTLPLSYLWPLDNTATALCPTHNSQKSDSFPIDFYTDSELRELSTLTGISLPVLTSRPINEDAVRKLLERVEWFFDAFLAEAEYQKVRQGKRAADLIVHALHNVLSASGHRVDLPTLYSESTRRRPTTITLGEN